MNKLHTKKDDELESKDQKMFYRSVVLAGIAVIVIFGLALLLVRSAGRRIQPVHPDSHPTSRLWTGETDKWVG